MTTLPAVSFSHFGLYVTDLPRMEDFYTRVLGLLVSDRGQVPGGSDLVFLSRDPDEHHQIVLATGRPPGVEFNVVNQISFKLPTLADLKAMHARARDEGTKPFRIVTHGNAWSVYFADPEGNRSTSRRRWRSSSGRPKRSAAIAPGSCRGRSGGRPR